MNFSAVIQRLRQIREHLQDYLVAVFIVIVIVQIAFFLRGRIVLPLEDFSTGGVFGQQDQENIEMNSEAIAYVQERRAPVPPIPFPEANLIGRQNPFLPFESLGGAQNEPEEEEEGINESE